jgi:hypothetical protein
MSDEQTPWTTVTVAAICALLLTVVLIGGLAYWGGQEWLLPWRSPQQTVETVTLPDNDPQFGLAEYVDRTVYLDAKGGVTIEGMDYNDNELRDYLKRLGDGGGVHVVLSVDAAAPTERRLQVEKICEEVTGLESQVVFTQEKNPTAPSENDLDAP